MYICAIHENNNNLRRQKMLHRFILILFWFLIPFMCRSAEPVRAPLSFELSFILNTLPNKEVQSIYQDRDGYLWIATRNGLFQYDGYSIVAYKSNFANPDLLTSNNILCVAEDNKHNLWIGTYSGLNVLDKRTGQMRKINNPEMNGNTIPQILVTKKGRILFATDWGLYEYDEKANTFRSFGYPETANVMPKTTVKALLEDDRGDIWIGTWDRGLYRYETATGKYFAYPRLNEQNSAHVLFQDSYKNIWVGTWRGGLTLLKDAYEPTRTTWVTYRSNPADPTAISDDIIYSIAEDINTGSLWVGTRRGLSVLSLHGGDYTGREVFSNYYPDDSEYSIASDEVTSVLCDRQGLMWMGMIGGGITKANTRKADFVWDGLQELKRVMKTTSVRSMLIDRDNCLWLGMGSYGLAVKDRNTGKTVYYTQLPDTHGYRDITTVMSIMQSSLDGHIWLAAYDDGAYEIEKKGLEQWNIKHYSPQEAPWLAGHCVYHVYEDSKHNLWFSTRNGVSMRRADGKAVRFDSLMVENDAMRSVVTLGVVEGSDGDIWVASGTHGVIRLHCDASSGEWKLQAYSSRNHKLNNDYVDCLHRDAHGRLWAGTGGSGLNYYDKESDSFLPMHARWNLPGDAVASIRDDQEGNLWLGTNAGLVRLTVPDNLKDNASFRLYTTIDGLQDNIFLRGAVTVAGNGEMFFGGHQGYNSFYPDSLEVQVPPPAVKVTDIKVYNQSWKLLPDAERTDISPLSPSFAEDIRLDYQHNNFSIEFSALDYASPQRNNYAYKLEGFDDDWQYTDASKRFAYYNNLKPGTYTFLLKASNSNGVWSKEPYRMKVVILPPPWETWWAYTLYVLLIVAAAYGTYRQVRNRIRLRNALHLREMEKAKVEEVNHAKLQFFTNITHELLTPLTILSASVDELKRVAPEYKDQYRVMNNNINRLIRLLQQILEFRKAESGNLKLKVSRADLALFVRRSLDSFRPLMSRKDMHFSLSCSPEPMSVYFDPDKLDKILYNLFSNASKYNRPGGTVSVTLEGRTDDTVCLIVKDDGAGIPKDAQKELFKRFYEGDYRKFKTIGTGIGLSLVRDLVVLHHGTIEVESEEGKGTAFIVTFPARRDAYAEEEIDDSLSEDTERQEVTPQTDIIGPDASETAAEEETEPLPPVVRRTLLIVEDSEDLLQLMTKLLGTDYNICTAANGKEAVEIVGNREVDLIVSDVMMPEMDGIELCRYIKGHFGTSHIPIILLTAKNKEEDRVEAYESGADAFISKPFSLSVLHARISNLLRTRERRSMDFKKQLVFEVKDLDYTSIDEDFLQRAIDCVNRHLADADFDQSDFLEEMHTSKSTCFRKLKSLTGQTYVSFVRNIRMKAACRIMEEKKNIRISDLAYAVGYNDPRYFSSSFKKEIGMQPTEYMERFTQGGGVIEE